MREKIDTSNWSIAIVDLGTHLFEHRTTESESELRAFCEKYGYKLVSFTKGTDPYCK